MDEKLLAACRAAFESTGDSVTLGAPVEGRDSAPEPLVRIPLSMMNRHGLIAGATGTGKTKTLQLMAEQLSAAGVPVFLADLKGDLSGLAAPGEAEARVEQRARDTGWDWRPGGVPVEFLSLTGARRQMSEAFRDLLFALVLGAGLVYVIMAGQFESLLHPLIIMFCIPFALIGLTNALLATGTVFSIVAFIGAILLVGYVVNTGILLVDYTNVLRRHGLPLQKAILIGGRTRLKPILMSTGTTMLGLLPMALGLGTGSELRAPMARAVFGGLASSTLITLLLIPTIYYLVEKRRERGRSA
jgi:multidrug efflux pump subunit AcrB